MLEDQKQILEAYLSEKLAEHGLELDEATLRLIHSHVSLEARRPDESEEVRSIEQKINSAGKHSAASIKLANISKFGTIDILKYAGGLAGIALFDDTAKKIIYAFVMLLIEFFPKLKLKFDEQDAQVIFAISKLPLSTFSTAELTAEFGRIFPPGLPPERLAASLDVLTDSEVLRQTGPDTFLLVERIKNLERK